MERKQGVIFIALLFIPLIAVACNQDNFPAPTIIDHTCTDLSEIPDEWIDSVQANLKIHYAHTSHGGQLTTGLSRIEAADPKYSVAIQDQALPDEAGALCIFDGQEHDTYITPDEYWETGTGMDYTRDVLTNNPSINVSMWSWCTQLNYYSEEQVQAYLDSISTLEAEFPNVTFVYMTCNAQATGAEGYNRYMNNEKIRQFCRDNDKVLFDFADLDAWWYNGSSWEHATYDYEGHIVPVEHEQFHGDEAAHTTYESCEQKGKAVWYMFALIAGWKGGIGVSENPSPSPAVFSITGNSPNPFSSETSIRYGLPYACDIRLAVYDVQGRLVRTLVDGNVTAGSHTVTWDSKDDQRNQLPAGTYFCQMRTPEGVKTNRMIRVK